MYSRKGPGSIVSAIRVKPRMSTNRIVSSRVSLAVRL